MSLRWQANYNATSQFKIFMVVLRTTQVSWDLVPGRLVNKST